MTTISSVGKVAYIYDEATTTWYPVAGTTNTSADFSWTGDHVFETGTAVTFTDVVAAKAGVNNFQNPTARDAAIPSPTPGIVAFVRQDNSGNAIRQIQYYSSASSTWVSYSDAQLVEQTASYVLATHDSGKVVKMDSSTSVVVTLPSNTTAPLPIGSVITIVQTGTGEVSFTEDTGVTIRSKNSYKKLNTQYSGAQVVKLDTNIWLLIGDIKA
jgi:hypothetical protein